MYFYIRIVYAIWNWYYSIKMNSKGEVLLSIPYFNIRTDWTLEALYSALDQSINVPVLVVDDGSSKPLSGLPYFAPFKANGKTVMIVRHWRNKGLYYSRNTASSLASGHRYIAFLDPDDKLHPLALETMLLKYKLNDRHSNLAFVYPSVNHMSENGRQLISIESFKFDSIKLMSQNYLSSFALIDRNVYSILGGMCNTFFEDWEFWKRMVLYGFQGVLVNSPIFFYRRHTFGLSHKISSDLSFDKPALSYKEKICHELVNINARKTLYSKRQSIISNNSNSQKLSKRRGKGGILVIIPWIDVGGAEFYDWYLLKNLENVTIIVESKDHNALLKLYQEITFDIWILPNVLDGFGDLNKACKKFINYLLESRDIKIVYTRNSLLGYKLMKFIKSHNPKILSIDIQHICSQDKLGWEYKTVSFHRYIDRRIFTNVQIYKKQQRILKRKKERITFKTIIYPPLDLILWKNGSSIENSSHIIQSNAIFFIGRLVDEKNPLLWLRVFAQVVKISGHSLVGIIIGDGYLRDQVKKLSMDLGILHFLSFYDYLDAQNIIFHYQKHENNILLITSTNEGLPMVALEALAIGATVITKNVGGIKDLINETRGSHKVFGFDNNNIDFISELIIKIIRNNHSPFRKDNINQTRQMLKKFSLEEFNLKIKNIFSFYP